MRSLLSRVILGVVAGVALYAALSIWADAGRVGQALGAFHWETAALALALAAANYLVRFLRWQYYLRVLHMAVPRGDSFLVFLAGFALTVTPGKLGEAVKSFLLRDAYAIPVARSAPIVVAERVTDLVGLLMLAAVGVFTFQVDQRFLIAGVILIVGGLAVVSVEPLARMCLRFAARLPVIRRVAPRLDDFYRSTAALLRPGPLAVAVVLSVASWFCECLGFWVIVRGFEGADVSLRAATFIYATMTIAGALSFLPGGLGVTEAGMLTLLGTLGTGLGRGTAAAATFVTRLTTLWFAVAVGLCALIAFARRRNVTVTASRGRA